ncbi:MAG: PQQ-binding-like beta-propeller repeat protein, partial [Clostridiales bacterium]|nr:PQQ-binding-like beta-propeller repeat protein [Clostridiales bacterium]
YEGLDDGAYRMNWGAFDSSPIIDGATDTLIWPCENGIIYSFQLNSQFNSVAGTVSVNPMCTGYKYIFNDTQGRFLGVESSAAVYGNYCYFMDNNCNLVCLDLNTFQMVWVFRTGDDSDLSPVVQEENGIPYIYIGTEVDNQNSGEYNGAAYTYKINGLTGAEVWQTSQSCYTYNGETSATDQSGGCVGNPIIGMGNISNLVIFSYSMTDGLTRGNRLVAYNRDTGTEVWHYDMNIYTYSSPVACYTADGNAYIIIADSFGQIHLVNGSTGERITYIQVNSEEGMGVTFEASPAVFGNILVIGTTDGEVFGIRID